MEKGGGGNGGAYREQSEEKVGLIGSKRRSLEEQMVRDFSDWNDLCRGQRERNVQSDVIKNQSNFCFFGVLSLFWGIIVEIERKKASREAVLVYRVSVCVHLSPI